MTTTITTSERTGAPRGSRPLSDEDLPGDEEFGRNLVGGRWELPLAPYEFEIRNPQTSTITTVVPLSSRFDVSRAVALATTAAPDWAADPGLRSSVLGRLADELERLCGPVAALAALESGLADSDARAQVRDVVRLIRHWLMHPPALAERPGVFGVELSWGGPLLEAATGVLPPLLAGHTVVVKPSLRAPLSAVALAHVASRAGLPPGVLNVVHGTGVDVGAALHGTPSLAGLHVRAGARTLGLAARSTTRSGVPFHPLRAGGGLLWTGRDVDVDVVADVVARALRLHDHAGAGAIPLLVAHAETAGTLVDAVLAAVAQTRPAALPTEPLRRRALDRLARQMVGGGRLLTGGQLPDDIPHRMGWLMPATVISIGAVNNGTPAGSVLDLLAEPTGPVLAVATWRSPTDLTGLFTATRHHDGVARVLDIDDDDLQEAALPHEVVLRDTLADGELRLPTAWTAGIPLGGCA